MSLDNSRPYLPQCWDDDVRMNAMFKKFRVKNLNPVGWNDQMDFWSTAISNFCKTAKKVVITEKDICEAFERNKRMPDCIDTVLKHMEQEGKIVTMTKFERSHSDWITWGVNVITKDVFSWAYSSVQSYLYSPPVERYVMVDVARNMAAEVVKKNKELQTPEKSSSIIYRDKFCEEYKDICGNSDENATIILTLLQESKEISLLPNDETTVIKFKEQTSDHKKTDVKTSKKLTDIDRSVLKLQRAIEGIEQEIEKHQDNVINLEQTIKEHVKTNRPKAMMFLKKKKLLEMTVDKKLATLDNLEKLLHQVKNTESDKLIVDAFKTASTALNNSMRKDLKLDNVDDLMEDLSQAMDDANEIQKTLANLGGTNETEDTDELEQELMDLLEEEENLTHLSQEEQAIKDSSLIAALEQLEVIDDSPEKMELPKKAKGMNNI